MVILKKPYLYWVIIIFLFYLFISILVSGFYNTIPLIIKYAKTVNWFKLILSMLLTIVIGILIAINSVLIYIKFKERKNCNKEITLSGIGTVGGLATGICPLCVTGLFPLVLGLLGISFSFASLPFQGIEIQLLIAIILFVSYVNLRR